MHQLLKNNRFNKIHLNLINSQAEDFFLSLKRKESDELHSNTKFAEQEDNYNVKNIKWPTIGEFNEKLAIEKIDEFMKTVRTLLL